MESFLLDIQIMVDNESPAMHCKSSQQTTLLFIFYFIRNHDYKLNYCCAQDTCAVLPTQTL